LKGGHDLPFKPAKHTREKTYKAKYEYIELKQNQEKKNYRDEEGAVVVAPRNFTTIPLKGGKVGKNTTFGGPVPYKEDDVFGNKKKIIKQEIEYH
jgi:guanyl-specific ribonuclease Sa